MKIQSKRLWQHIQVLGQIGQNKDGSVTRLAFTDEDEQAALQIRNWMEEAGLEVSVDACGNIIGKLEGSQPELPPLVCGSHFDTVSQGGMFDGCLGVLAGIEALQTMTEEGYQPRRTILVIGFRDEEGNRFGYGMVGSKSVAGIFQPEGLQAMDEDEHTLQQIMNQRGYTPQDYISCRLHPYAYFELHIEQASVLEEQNVPVGIVEGISALHRYTITVYGKSGHAGAIPMAQRCDPVPVMCQWITGITELAKEYPSTVATIGSIQTTPGVCNTICDHASFSLDIRSLKNETLEEILGKMRAREEHLPAGIRIEWKLEQILTSCICEEAFQTDIEQICQEEEIPAVHLVSGAGHDCMNFKGVCPTSMIFVRSADGASHKKEEYSTSSDCAAGCQILYRMLAKHSQL